MSGGRALVIHHSIVCDSKQPRREGYCSKGVALQRLLCLKKNLAGEILGRQSIVQAYDQITKNKRRIPLIKLGKRVNIASLRAHNEAPLVGMNR